MAETSYITPTEQAKLDDFQSKYLDKQGIYNIEFTQNTQGHANLQNGIWQTPWNGVNVGEVAFKQWMNASDASLVFKKNNMDAAKKTYDDYNTWLENQVASRAQKASADFAKNNPTIAAQILKDQNEIAADTQLKEKALNFAASNSKTITYVGIAIVIIFVIVYSYKILTRKTAPAAE